MRKSSTPCSFSIASGATLVPFPALSLRPLTCNHTWDSELSFQYLEVSFQGCSIARTMPAGRGPQEIRACDEVRVREFD